VTEHVHPVRIEPAGIVIEVPAGEPLMAAARRQGYRWPNVCGGEAMCGVCMVKVREGAEHTPPKEDKEIVRLQFVDRTKDDTARLACQLMVSGPVTVFRRGVRKEVVETVSTTDDV
jgi:2Fe-2S ferredoxin